MSRTLRYPPTRAGALQMHREATTTDVPQAGAFFGLGINASFDAFHRGEFPVPVLTLGRRKLRVPTAEILRALGIAPSDEPTGITGPDAAA